MRSPMVLGLVVFLGGCAAIRHLDEYSVGGDSGISSGDGAESAIHSSSIDASAGCTSHRACNEAALAAGTGAPAMCVRATGACMPVTSPACPTVTGDVENDDAILVGTLLGASDGTPTDATRAAVLAAEELSNAGGAIAPIVIVGCRAGADALAAAHHLVDDLHVPAILGPSKAEDVVAVTQQVSAHGGTLVFTDSPVASIANLADDDLTWRSVTADTQHAKLIIAQVQALETLLRTTRSLTSVKLGIVHADDAAGTSALDAISGKLILNGHFILDAANAANVSVDAYTAGDAIAATAVATAYARSFRPDIVFLTAADQIASIMVPLEQSFTAARIVDHPYYVLAEAARTGELLARIDAGALPADIRRRIRGVGPVPDATSSSVFADFVTAFALRYGVAPAASAAAAYDAMYAVGAAVAATPGPVVDGARVAHGLRSLAVGSPVVIGARSVADVGRQLAVHQPVSLRGTFGPLQWDANGDLRAGTVEVWCIGSRDGMSAFGTSGMTMDVETQVVGGAYVQCQ